MALFGRLFKKDTPVRAAAPLVAPEGPSLKDIPGAWQVGNWVPDWSAVQTWMDQNTPADKQVEFRKSLVDSWLHNLATDLGSPYTIYTTKNFRVLCPYDERKAKSHLEFLESAREQLANSFGLGNIIETLGPHVVLMFYDQEEHLHYLPSYTEVAERNDYACGMFVRGGYNHIALYDIDKYRMETTQATELTRDLVSHLDLPLWIEEGLARLASGQLGGQVLTQVKEIRLAEDYVRDCWRKHGPQEFWSGSAFSWPDSRLRKRAFQLAEILTRVILDAHKDKFAAFAAAAAKEDAGEAAAKEHLGVSLNSIFTDFLGPAPVEEAKPVTGKPK